MFVHLHVHSHYSRLRGTASIKGLLEAARQLSMPMVALTDANTVRGFIHFVTLAPKVGVLPIAGSCLERGDDEAVVLVENQTGYENLCRLLSRLYDNEAEPLAEIIRCFHGGLFFLSPHRATILALREFIPSSHLFVEFRPGFEEKGLLALAREAKLEAVATGDVHFLAREDQESHRLLRAIAMNTTLSRQSPGDYRNGDYFFCDEAEMRRRFPNSGQAIDNSLFLARRCKGDWRFLDTIFPRASLRDIYHDNERLRELVHQGAQRRYREITPVIAQRMKMELDLITRKGFAPYFLIVHDIVGQTRATIGRGSGAGSIVSYCLFITQVDPVRHALAFQRFMHEDRVDMPDLDIDFCWDERDRIIDYVFKKYGRERVAMVANHVFLQPRSAVREVAKVHGLGNDEINQLTRRLSRSFGSNLVERIKDSPRARALKLEATHLEILRQSEKIIGVYHQTSVHPGGVIVVPDEIRKYVPVLTATKGVPIVEWEKDQVEDSGLLKIDLLGNRSLSVVRDTIKRLSPELRGAIDYHKLDPVDDPKTIALLASGKSMGIFYIESPASRQLLERAGRVDFEHVVIYSSIIRPAANRFIHLLLARIHGEPWSLPHPHLEFLRQTYGIIVYEDQVLLAAHDIAGFSWAAADGLRKTMSRPARAHLLPEWRRKFVVGGEKRGYASSLMEELWEMIASFIGYSFCKAHSASYAMLSFTCAYLKAHFPAHFLAAVIANRGGFYSTYAYLSEARRWGIALRPPDINHSERETFAPDERTILLGFSHIRELSDSAIEATLRARRAGPFHSLGDFLARVDPTTSDALALARAGCFLAIEPGLDQKRLAISIVSRAAGEPPLDLASPVFKLSPLLASPGFDYRREVAIFGFPLCRHPLALYSALLPPGRRRAVDLARSVGRLVWVAGVHIAHKVIPTKNGQLMEFLTLEDESGLIECVLFPRPFAEFGDLIHWEFLFIAEGRVDIDFQVPTLRVERLLSLHQTLRRGVVRAAPRALREGDFRVGEGVG